MAKINLSINWSSENGAGRGMSSPELSIDEAIQELIFHANELRLLKFQDIESEDVCDCELPIDPDFR